MPFANTEKHDITSANEAAAPHEPGLIRLLKEIGESTLFKPYVPRK